MTANAFTQKYLALGSCKEAIDWCEANHVQDFKTAYRTCPAPEFLCWGLVRILGLEGARAPLACAAAAAQLYVDPNKNGDPNLKPCLALCLDVIEGRSADLKTLQVLAYDLSAAGLGSKKGNGAILVSAAYAAYCVVFARRSREAADPAEKRRLILKASSHASDCASSAWGALPKLGAALPQVVRETIKEDVALRAWAAIPADG